MKNTVISCILFIFCTCIVFSQITPEPSPTPDITPHPDGYTVNVYTEGADYPVEINYWGGPEGRDTTPFSIFSATPYDVKMEPGKVDIKEDFTSGYYLWIWDNHSYYGTSSTIWGQPVETASFTVYSSNPVTEMKLMYADYDDPIVLPSIYPTPLGTSIPTPPPVQLTFVDSVTGVRIPDSDITVNLIYYDTFNLYHSWNSSQIIVTDDYMVRKLLQVTATGYHEYIVFSNEIITGSQPVTVNLYKTSIATPKPENSPVVLLKATPTPGPKTDAAWYYLVDLAPPDIGISFKDTVQAVVDFSYHHTGFRVIDWGIPEISGNIVTIDTQIIEWDGAAALWSTHLNHTYNLGPLTQGQAYTLVFQEWGKTIEEIPFTVLSPQPPPPAPEPPWQVYLSPMLSMETVAKGDNTCALLTASLYENASIAHTINDWGEVTRNGSVFTVNPVIYRNTEAASAYALRYYSYTYDLGQLNIGTYTFRVVSEGTEIYRQQFELVETFAPLPTIQPLPTTGPDAAPVVRASMSIDKVSYPASTFEVTVKNYGAPCSVLTHKFLTDPVVSITPGVVSPGVSEEAVFTVTVDWSKISTGESYTTYNGFIVTDSAEYRQYLPWEMILEKGTCTGPSGDVNGDGRTDIIDALLVAQYYVEIIPGTFYADQADVNGSGTIDIIDALLIAQYYVGLIPGFPGC